jgi:hypothetical protein
MSTFKDAVTNANNIVVHACQRLMRSLKLIGRASAPMHINQFGNSLLISTYISSHVNGSTCAI